MQESPASLAACGSPANCRPSKVGTRLRAYCAYQKDMSCSHNIFEGRECKPPDRQHRASYGETDPLYALLERHGIQPMFRQFHLIKGEAHDYYRHGKHSWEFDFGMKSYRVGYYARMDLPKTKENFELAQALGQGVRTSEDAALTVAIRNFTYDLRLAMFLCIGVNPYDVEYRVDSVNVEASHFRGEGWIQLGVSFDFNALDTVQRFTALKSSWSFSADDIMGEYLKWEKHNGFWNADKFVSNFILPSNLFSRFRDANVFPDFDSLRCEATALTLGSVGHAQYMVKVLVPPKGDVEEMLNPKPFNPLLGMQVEIITDNTFARLSREFQLAEINLSRLRH
jgi:hypothetical protein